LKKDYKLYIKNMVCPRCIMAVKDILDKLNIEYIDVRLGEAIISQPKSSIDIQTLKNELEAIGFELIQDQQVQYVEKIKSLIIDLIRNPEENKNPYNYSRFISDQIGKDYHYLSKLFSEKEGITIEKYLILQRIEYVKELLIYNEYNLSEIADKLNYSSVSHLSNQFKQVTGFSPTEFKKMQDKDRRTLDEI
jgi:AraC-like DNA-binding protein